MIQKVLIGWIPDYSWTVLSTAGLCPIYWQIPKQGKVRKARITIEELPKDNKPIAWD